MKGINPKREQYAPKALLELNWASLLTQPQQDLVILVSGI